MDDPDDEDPGEHHEIPIIMNITPSDSSEQSSMENIRSLLFPTPSRPFLAPRAPFAPPRPRHAPVLPPLFRMRERQKICRHTIIECRYCIDECEVCQVCGRRPFLNWLYYCAEDTSDYVQRIDPRVSPVFTPWAQKAIEDGQYTEEQREILMRQKLQVLETAAYQRALDLDPDTSVAQKPPTQVGELTDDNVWVENVEDVTKQIGQSQSSDSTHSDEEETVPLPMMPRNCNFTACRFCEIWILKFPIAERTYLSLDEVCNDQTIRPPSAWDLRDRPVSDANIVRNLGLRSRPPASVDRNNVGTSGIVHGDVGVQSQEDLTTPRPAGVDVSPSGDPTDADNNETDETIAMGSAT